MFVKKVFVIACKQTELVTDLRIFLCRHIFGVSKVKLFLSHHCLQVVDGVEHFEYPVQSEVEKESKFNAIDIKEVTYRPYRRVCILNKRHFYKYLNCVSSAECF